MNVPKKSAPDSRSQKHHARVLTAAFLAAGSFVTAIATILAIAGEWGTPDSTVKYAITVAGIVAALPQFVAAVLIWPRE
ncbi:hypothetical protein [Actinoplanes aureus]|uniref:Uncharacterized protein n=1 Tax=Actinoplanes aureus TaxID=2792083 RepID=A0A931C5V8_9ACTN|nr:hypothetical protein [Actinoplanes aureus]MBG0560711.1 hypothetical protein [Actinoplanes aureus]